MSKEGSWSATGTVYVAAHFREGAHLLCGVTIQLHCSSGEHQQATQQLHEKSRAQRLVQLAPNATQEESVKMIETDGRWSGGYVEYMPPRGPPFNQGWIVPTMSWSEERTSSRLTCVLMDWLSLYLVRILSFLPLPFPGGWTCQSYGPSWSPYSRGRISGWRCAVGTMEAKFGHGPYTVIMVFTCESTSSLPLSSSVSFSAVLPGMLLAYIQSLITGEDLAQGVGFWYAFLTSFWGAKTMVLSKREGLLPGPGLALSFWFPFFLELWLLYFLLSWCFFGRYLGCNSVPGQGLDSCVVVWLSFLLLFWLALSLLSWSLFCSLLLCSWVPGTRVGSLRGRFSSC